MGMLYLIDDPEFTKQLVFAYISSSGMYNAGNILAHVNKDN